MNGIFISYRRDDSSGYAGRLYDRLAAHFGADRVFMDVEGIEPGTDFVEAIDRAIGSCQILIVIIGKEWLAPDASGHRRIDDAADFVRVETVMALSRGIRVVPVLVDGAQMPRIEDLPMELAPLVRRQAVELSHKQWEATSAELVHTLEKILARATPAAAAVPATRERAGPAAPRAALGPTTPVESRDGHAEDGAATAGDGGGRPRKMLYAAAAVAIAAIAVVALLRWLNAPSGTSPPFLAVTPAQLQFGAAPLQAPQPAAEITLQNRGGSAMHVASVKVEGAHAGDFALVDDQCGSQPLQPGASCTIGVVFRAAFAGVRTAAIVIQSKEARSPVVIGLQGTGAPPVIAAQPAAAAPPAVSPAPSAQAPPAASAAPAPSAAPAAPAAPATRATPVAPAQPPAASSVPQTTATAPAAPHATPTRPSPPTPAAAPSSVPKAAPASPPATTEPPSRLVTVPDVVGRPRGEAVAALSKLGLEASVVDARPDAGGGPSDAVVAQTPPANERVGAHSRIELQIARNAAQAALPPAPPAVSGLPRVGDTWQYRYRSMWRNVEPRTYAHRVDAASPREVRETMTFNVNGATVSDTKSFSADARLVEWRGQGYSIVEFNPFLQALGGLEPGMSWKSLPTPFEDPFFGDWYTQGRALGWESVAVPAGTFKALRVEVNSNRNARANAVSDPARVLYVMWYAPEAKRTVRHVRTVFTTSGNKIAEDTFELTQYALK